MVGLRVNRVPILYAGYGGKLSSYGGVGIIMASIRQLGVIDGLTAGLTSIDIVPER
jgi:hypothetical protein